MSDIVIQLDAVQHTTYKSANPRLRQSTHWVEPDAAVYMLTSIGFVFFYRDLYQ